MMVPKKEKRARFSINSRTLSASLVSLLLLIVFLVTGGQLGFAKQAQQASGKKWNWTAFGGESADDHFVPLNQINKSNVDQLKMAWAYPTHDKLSYMFNPVEVDGVLYVLAHNNSLVALNAATGKEIWVHGGLAGIAPRGIAFWQSKDGKDKRLIFEFHNQLQEINAETGKSILSFGDDGYVDLRAGFDRPKDKVYSIMSRTPGQVYGNLFITGASTGEEYGAPPGDVRAYNVLTGKMVWKFHVIPHPGQKGYNTWPAGNWKFEGGADPWSGFSIDRKHGIVYLPTGGPKYELYGGDRPGDNYWSDSIIALNVLTGKLVWGFQAVHHDVWDYDMCSAPQLITIEHDGKKVDAVAAAGKTGFLYVFNRLTGKPIWPIVERPVPQSHVPGEHTSPTQPFPTDPPPFVPQQYTAAEINPYLSSAQKENLEKQIADAVNGPIFTPPELHETIETPGNRGGANWGTSASDPNTGMVYVLGFSAPALLKLSPKPKGSFASMSQVVVAGETPGHALYVQHCAACHGVDRKGAGSVPSLVDITKRLSAGAIRNQIQNGGGQMPAFSSLTGTEISELISYLANPATGGERPFGRRRLAASPAPPKLGGKVVAWGGAPAGQAAYKRERSIRSSISKYGILNGPPYPKGFKDAVKNRYWTGWNVNYGITAPPWMTLTAYNLNKGTIQWQVSAGGVPGLVDQQSGAVVTASGLVFLATLDGKVRAYDARTGKLLWTGELPAGAYGIPAMYQWNGREYLVICATMPVEKPAVVYPASPAGAVSARKFVREYVAFALPEK